MHHITWSINSICHFFGSRRFETDDESTNVFWLALPSLGEAWHHNHHAFPQSAFHGLRWYELDPLRVADPGDGAGGAGLGRRQGDARARPREKLRPAAWPDGGAKPSRRWQPARTGGVA